MKLQRICGEFFAELDSAYGDKAVWCCQLEPGHDGPHDIEHSTDPAHPAEPYTVTHRADHRTPECAHDARPPRPPAPDTWGYIICAHCWPNAGSVV